MRNIDSVPTTRFPRTSVAAAPPPHLSPVTGSKRTNNSDASILIIAGLGLLALVAAVYGVAIASGIDAETFKLLTLYP
ncbi:MAG: hypothetical protein AB7O60_05415 [Variibacter sp.]